MEYEDLVYFLQHVGKDPSRLIFEDELTGIYNRRFLLNYLQYRVAWDSVAEQPLSLIMLDVDRFKEVNDTHGHEIGDLTLAWVAGLLREVAGEQAFPVRYAGDEFIILIPGAAKEPALQLAEKLINRVHQQPVQLEQIDGVLYITFSIGVASAPEDADSGKALIQQADTALYYAKKAGRDRLANATEVIPQEVFTKTALYQLDRGTIAGRRAQLAEVAAALKRFGQRQSQFLIIEGAAGMGKSELLQSISRNLAQSKIRQVALKGSSQELFRPYYLSGNIVVELLKQRPDQGAAVVELLSPREITYLAQILPQLGEADEALLEEDEKQQRQGIFTSLVHFIPRVVDSRPLILLIDDLHFADQATLLLLRRLLLRQDIPLFICATALEQDQASGQPAPLLRFLPAYQEELGIRRVALTPLSAADIAHHLQGLFPQVSLPENFQQTLAQITQGNPLFLSEIIRKLVLDEKITLAGQQWVIEPLEQGYLPRSLEEIVSEKIARLDEESRQLLDQAATFGEDVSLSMLAGSSESREARVLEFIDQAMAQGLVKTEFQINDEAIRFLGKRVLEITYGTIQPERKQQLHECIGAYQETLYEQRLLPSVATLAYHFKRSANQEKARIYRRSQEDYNTKVFNAEEAVHYTAEEVLEAAAEEEPLDPESLPLLPAVIRGLLTAVRNIRLYPPGSKAIETSVEKLRHTLSQILAANERLHIAQVEKELVVNGEPLDTAEFRPVAEGFMKFLQGLDLKGIAFGRGLTGQELSVTLEALGRIGRKMLHRRFWQRFATEQRLLHIELKQVRYTAVAEPEQRPEAAGEPAVEFAADYELDQEDLEQIPQLIRCLLAAAGNIKLYPPESKTNRRALEELKLALDKILGRRPALTLAWVGEALLVNGAKIDTADFKTLAEGFHELLEEIGLRSITFLQPLASGELQSFIAALGRTPAAGLDSDFWQAFALERRLRNIFFDQHLYGIVEDLAGIAAGSQQPLTDTEALQAAQTGTPDSAAAADLPPSEAEQSAIQDTLAEPAGADELTDDFLERLPEDLSDLFLQGRLEEARELLERLFHHFPLQSQQKRQQIIRLCAELMQEPGLGRQPRWTELMIEPLLLALREEEELPLLEETGSLLSRAATALILASDYQKAARIFSHLQRRQRQLHESSEHHSLEPEITLVPDLAPEVQKILSEELRSSEPSRQQQAALLLGTLGPGAIPVLIEVIKQEEDFKVRQLAARLLADLGPEAADKLKAELVIEGFAEQRLQILEVIDTVARELKTELAYALGDGNPKVRRAAFALAERLNDTQAAEVLRDYAGHQELPLAVAAIKSLGQLKPPGVVDFLVSLLNSARESERLIACCRALALLADPAAIDPLAKLLSPGGLLSIRKKRSALVRATAAFALAQIPDPRAAKLLASHVNDRDPRVRQVARELAARQEKAAEEKEL